MFSNRLENARMLTTDGRKAHRLYFIVSGKLCIVRRFELREGNLFRVMGQMGAGETTDVRSRTKLNENIFFKKDF